MKFFLIFLAVVAYVSADCGCLKCSKHLSVAGEVIGEPRCCGPVKVIYRGDSAPHFPNCARNSPYPVQKPYAPYGPYGYAQIPEYGRPLCADCRPCKYPIQVQKPVELPAPSVCVPLVGLKACIDRVVLPAPECCGYEHHPVVPGRGPLLEAFDYESLGYNHPSCRRCRYATQNICILPIHIRHKRDIVVQSMNKNNTEMYPCRSKRQVLKHGYKFMMNMLPPFVQDPIKHTVNVMALTHPDKKLQKMYNQPVKLTLSEKLAIQHKKNLADIKNKLLGNVGPNLKKNHHYKHADERVIQKEADDFLSTLNQPLPKKKYAWLTTRTPPLEKEPPPESSAEREMASWLQEMKVKEIIREELRAKSCSSEKKFAKKYKSEKKHGMTEKEKALFLQKLKKLNQENYRHKRDVEDEITCKSRNRRAIVMDSEKFGLPFYRIKVKDSTEDESHEEYEYEDEYDEYDSHENPLRQSKYGDYNSRENALRKSKYEDYDSRENVLRRSKYDDYDSREEILRRAVRKELEKFKKEKSSEEVQSPFNYNKIVPHSPVFHLLSLPMRMLGNAQGLGKGDLPILTAVPKMIIGTKSYFRNFGRNFKKNALHFASDLIGDFDHHGPTDNMLGGIFRQKRSTDNLSGTEAVINEEAHKEQYEPEYSLDFQNMINSQNFRNGCENKVRKKRYILKMVDEDEVEQFLRQKLGKMYNIPENNPEKRKRRYRKRRASEENDDLDEREDKPYKRRKKYRGSREDYNNKIVIEKLNPKVIIDNNGLPFMEVDGYKRPIFVRSQRFPKKKYNSIEETAFTPFDSSEDANYEKIDHLIGHAKNNQKKPPKNTEVPMQTVKEKISDLLYETDLLVHLNFGKYDEIYDDLLEIQYIKASVVQDWKRLIMEKRINDHNGKIDILGKFKEMQHIKDIAVRNIVNALNDEHENKFVINKLTKMLVRLQKLQCVINQVVGCFQEKFKMGTKFDMHKEIKFVDFLASLNFVNAKTRNDLVSHLKHDRDSQLQENIKLLEKLKRLLVDEEDDAISEEAHLLWEMRNIEKMQRTTIEEMHQRQADGYKIKKNLKILFDLTKRLEGLENQQDEIHSENEDDETSEEFISDEKRNKVKVKKPPKFNVDEFLQKCQEKLEGHREMLQKKLEAYKAKRKDNESNEDD